MAPSTKTGLQRQSVDCVFLTPSGEDFESAVEAAGAAVHLVHAASIAEAADHVAETGARVLLASDKLGDGKSWETARDLFRDLERPVAIVVVAVQADERLWIDVLELGAFDLLQIPIWGEELRHVVENADAHARRGEVCVIAALAENRAG